MFLELRVELLNQHDHKLFKVSKMAHKRPLPGQKRNLLFYLNNQPSEKRQMDQPTVYLQY